MRDVKLKLIALFSILYAFSLTYSYHLAANINRDASFLLFWVALLPLVLTAFSTLSSKTLPSSSAIATLTLLGFLGSLPKALRSWGEPLFSDEFAHMVVIKDLTTKGFIDPVNPLVRMSPDYPVLHLLVSLLSKLSNQSEYILGFLLITLLHALVPLSVYLICKRLSLNSSASALAALLYISNPSWLFFQMSLSYESVAIPLALWAVLALTVALTSKDRKELVYSFITLLTILAALAFTHHLTSILMIMILTTLSVIILLRRRKNNKVALTEPLWVPASSALWLLAVFTTWTWDHYEKLKNYLSPSVTRPYNYLLSYLKTNHNQNDPSPRKPFSGSTLPIYEQIPGLLLPFILLIIFLLAASLLIPRISAVSSLYLLALTISSFYFLTLPTLLTQTGAEGVRRTWAVSYIGLSILLAYLVNNKESKLQTNKAVGQGMLASMILRSERIAVKIINSSKRRYLTPVLASFILIGGVATGVNEAYRFPGAWEVGNDSRSYTIETKQLAEKLRTIAKPGSKVLADRYIRGRLALVSDLTVVNPSKTFPAWNVTLSTGEEFYKWSAALSKLGIKYLVLDKRMATDNPVMGYWYVDSEPRVSKNKRATAIRLINCSYLYQEIYSTKNYSVYEIASKLDKEIISKDKQCLE